MIHLRSNKTSLLAFFAFALFWISPAIADFAEPIDTPSYLNLADLDEAETYAQHLIAELKSENDGSPKELLIQHFGNEIPKQLEWVILHLDKAREKIALENNRKRSQNETVSDHEKPFSYTVKLIRDQEIATDIENARDQASEMSTVLSYLEESEGRSPGELQQKARNEISELAHQAQQSYRRSLGVADGLTIWVIPRTFKEKCISAAVCLGQSGLAAASLSFSLYLASTHGKEVNIPASAATLATWVWINMHLSKTLSKTFNQGRRLSIDSEGKVKVVPGYALGYISIVLRSLVTNFLITSTAFGFDVATSPAGLIASGTNTLVNTFARAWIDRILEVKRQDWSHAKWDVTNQSWNFLYGLSKNLNLLGVSWLNDALYYTMGTIGIVKTLIKEKIPLQQGLAKIKDKIAGKKSASCRSLLQIRTTNPETTSIPALPST